jgi:lysophospholipase L1-like esterase
MTQFVVANLLCVATILLVVECGARVFLARPVEPLFSDRELRIRNRPFVERNERRGFALRSGRFALWGGEVRINRDGFRGDELPPDLKDRFTVVALGDSTTFGWKLAQNADYPSRLARLLDPSGSGRIAVVNAGVPSYTSSQVRLFLEEILESQRIDPELVLVSVMWNDLWYSGLPKWYPEVLVYQRPAAWRLLLVQHSRFMRAFWMRAPPGGARRDRVNERALAHYVRNLEEMIRLCAARNVALALVAPPFDADHVPAAGIPEPWARYGKAQLIELARHFDAAAHELAAARGVLSIDHRLSLRDLHQADHFFDPRALREHGMVPSEEGRAGLAGGPTR